MTSSLTMNCGVSKETKFDYWMLRLIAELAIKDKANHTPNHAGCDYICKNKWCSVGKLNLLAERVDTIQTEISQRFEAEALRTPPTPKGAGIRTEDSL